MYEKTIIIIATFSIDKFEKLLLDKKIEFCISHEDIDIIVYPSISCMNDYYKTFYLDYLNKNDDNNFLESDYKIPLLVNKSTEKLIMISEVNDSLMSDIKKMLNDIV